MVVHRHDTKNGCSYDSIASDELKSQINIEIVPNTHIPFDIYYFYDYLNPTFQVATFKHSDLPCINFSEFLSLP